ncbi:hypothetical protein BJ508DRAFT_307794 [Ascobolus immersus RN42]|uniref:Uncharacterized protein n=1 Tax=Ascobolus immersus RN42 TaxID=1160509 RepID=A0A3N4I1U6_ASCIM|nr:hypothetical protein BJ508DRAFT_307794 [Ascobolus immersus RN42]
MQPPIQVFSLFLAASALSVVSGAENKGCKDIHFVVTQDSGYKLTQNILGHVITRLDGGHNFGNYNEVLRFKRLNSPAEVRKKKAIYESKLRAKEEIERIQGLNHWTQPEDSGQSLTSAETATTELLADPTLLDDSTRSAPTAAASTARLQKRQSWYNGLLGSIFGVKADDPPQGNTGISTSVIPPKPVPIVPPVYNVTYHVDYHGSINKSSTGYTRCNEYRSGVKYLSSKIPEIQQACPFPSRIVGIGITLEAIPWRWLLNGRFQESRAWYPWFQCNHHLEPLSKSEWAWDDFDRDKHWDAGLMTGLVAVALLNDPSHAREKHDGMEQRLTAQDKRPGYPWKDRMRSWAFDGHVCSGKLTEMPLVQDTEFDLESEEYAVMVGDWILDRLEKAGIMRGPLPGLVHKYESLEVK